MTTPDPERDPDFVPADDPRFVPYPAEPPMDASGPTDRNASPQEDQESDAYKS